MPHLEVPDLFRVIEIAVHLVDDYDHSIRSVVLIVIIVVVVVIAITACLLPTDC